jgi:AraC family transcriptional regulator
MHMNLGRGITLKELSDSVKLSPGHFSRLFRQSLRVAPLEHFRALRMARVRELLKFSTMRIKEIALMLGYRDMAHFTHAFVKVNGMSPRAFRKKRR